MSTSSQAPWWRDPPGVTHLYLQAVLWHVALRVGAQSPLGPVSTKQEELARKGLPRPTAPLKAEAEQM